MISLIIPIYNEQENIKGLNARLTAFFMEYRVPHEVIFVNDGSTDGSLQQLQLLCENGYKIISYEENRGKGYALRRGVDQAQGDYIFYTDADLTYGLSPIKKAMGVFDRYHCDIVVGSRRLAKIGYDESDVVQKIAGATFAKAFSGLISSYLHIAQTDTQCGFKGFTAHAARHLFEQCRINGFGIDFEVLYLAAQEHMEVKEMAAWAVNAGKASATPVQDTLKIVNEMKSVKRIHNRKREGWK